MVRQLRAAKIQQSTKREFISPPKMAREIIDPQLLGDPQAFRNNVLGYLTDTQAVPKFVGFSLCFSKFLCGCSFSVLELVWRVISRTRECASDRNPEDQSKFGIAQFFVPGHLWIY